jgi:Protein of unknown function (DUF3617)
MRCILLATVGLASTLALAADISPGSWEITMETRVPAEPGFAPPPFQLTRCFTEADARDPSRVLGTVSNPGASSCNYSDKSYSGNTFSFSMQCAGSFAIKASGRVSFTADSMQGTIDSTATVADKPVQTLNKISARRLGGC